MTRRTTIVQVFVSSPSDVAKERDILEVMADEMNKVWGKTSGISFEILRWESNVRPALADSPQEVINQQIGDDYDVFIGILWGRIGTQTQHAVSGTVEEFDRAIARAKATGSPEIMFYFKDAAISPSKIDAEQLRKVQEFQKSLGPLGVMYSSFEDDSGFQTSLRAHFAALAQKFTAESSREQPKDRASIESKEIFEELIDELGFLDYLEIYQQRVDDYVASLGIVSDATLRMGRQFEARTAELSELSQTSPDMASAKRLIKRAADDMQAFASALKGQIPPMSEHRKEALNALSNALILRQDLPDQDDSELANLGQSINGLDETLSGTRKSLSEFRSIIDHLPRLTVEINKAKRIVVQQIDLMISEIDATHQNICNIQASIRKILENPG